MSKGSPFSPVPTRAQGSIKMSNVVRWYNFTSAPSMFFFSFWGKCRKIISDYSTTFQHNRGTNCTDFWCSANSVIERHVPGRNETRWEKNNSPTPDRWNGAELNTKFIKWFDRKTMWFIRLNGESDIFLVSVVECLSECLPCMTLCRFEVPSSRRWFVLLVPKFTVTRDSWEFCTA